MIKSISQVIAIEIANGEAIAGGKDFELVESQPGGPNMALMQLAEASRGRATLPIAAGQQRKRAVARFSAHFVNRDLAARGQRDKPSAHDKQSCVDQTVLTAYGRDFERQTLSIGRHHLKLTRGNSGVHRGNYFVQNRNHRRRNSSLFMP